MLTIYIYNCTILHKKDHDRNKMRVIRATAIQKLHKMYKIDVSASICSNFNGYLKLSFHEILNCIIH